MIFMKNKLKIIIPIALIIILAIVIITLYIINKDKTTQASNSTTNIRGVVKTVNINNDNKAGSIYVEGSIGPESQYDKATIRITEQTSIVKDDKDVKISDINVGDIVQVTFTGAVAESYPIQAVASYISIF